MSETAQPDPKIKTEQPDTPEGVEVKNIKKDNKEKTAGEKEEEDKKNKNTRKNKEEKEAEKGGKGEEGEEKRKKEKGEKGEQSDNEDKPQKKKRKEEGDGDTGMGDAVSPLPDDESENSGSEKEDGDEDTDMDDAIPPLPDDESENSGSEEGGPGDNGSDGGSDLTEFTDKDFEDVRKNFPNDDNPEYRALEMKRRNYDLINAIEPWSDSPEMFIHKIRGHCATLGFVKKYGGSQTLYLNQYGGIDIKKQSNRTWWRLECQAEDEEYERLAENDGEFQRENSLQLDMRLASTKRHHLQLTRRFKKIDAKLSGAAWETDWDRIPWHEFEWKKFNLTGFEDARRRHDENTLSQDQFTEILHFQIMHEINQIDLESEDHEGGTMIYVRTLWNSTQYPVSWEPQSNTQRVYGKSQRKMIVRRSNTNGDRYVEGVYDPSLLRERESSVEMYGNGVQTHTDSQGNQTLHISNNMNKKYELKPMSRRSQSPQVLDSVNGATIFNLGGQDWGGRPESEYQQMMMMMKQLGLQLNTLSMNQTATGSKVAALEETVNQTKNGRRTRR